MKITFVLMLTLLVLNSAICESNSAGMLSTENYRLMKKVTAEKSINIEGKYYFKETKALIAYMEAASKSDTTLAETFKTFKKWKKAYQVNKNEKSRANYMAIKSKISHYMFKIPKINPENRDLYKAWVEAHFATGKAIAEKLKEINNSAGMKYLSTEIKIKKLLLAKAAR